MRNICLTLIVALNTLIIGNVEAPGGTLKQGLGLRDESERELRAWGGRTVEIPDYKRESSRAGFVYRGGKSYNSGLGPRHR